MNFALPFAATKIQPPRVRSALLERPALHAALVEALTSARVVLLQANAGFGKTSALAAALHALPAGTALAWISLDDDDDAQRLIACLTAALEPFDLPWRIAPELLATLPQAHRAVGEIVNALAGAEAARGVIVLDDLHRVHDAALQRALELLIERLPLRWTLALCTRVTPPLALARWRAAGELAAFEQERLSFSAAETLALARAEGIAPAQAAALHERTAGWPAGVRLGLASLRARPALAAHTADGATSPRLDRPLFEFLASEVLDQLPAALHGFLLRVAVLPELTAASAAAVSGDRHADLQLDEIERRGLFASALDAPERTLVLHDLFRDALLDRLRRRHADEWPALLRRASAATVDPLRRVGLLLRVPDPGAAEAALDLAAPSLLLGGGASQIDRSVAGFDAAWRDASPTLLRLRAMTAYLRWDWEACAQAAAAAARCAQSRGNVAERQLAQAYLANALYPLDRNEEALALIASLRAEPALTPHAKLMMLMAEGSQHLRNGDLPQLPALYAQVLDLIERDGAPYNWWEAAPPVNWTTLPGMRRLTERYLAGVRARLGDEPLPLVADLRNLEAFNHLWAGRLEEAQATAAQAAQDLRWLAVSGEAQINLDILCLLIEAMQGRADAAHERLERLIARVEDDPQAAPARKRIWQHHMAIYGVRVSDLLGATPEVIAQWASRLKENPLEDLTPANARAIFTRARHAAAQQRWDDAAALFTLLLPRAPRMDVMGQAIELQLRTAHALLRCGRLDDAAAALRPALERVARDRELGQTLLAGAGVLRTLAAAAWNARLSAQELATLQAASALAERARVAAAPAAVDVPARAAAAALLSEREQQVLHALAEGRSNKLIARELDLSPHTVKRHVANILDKLGLASRGQAAAWLHRQNTAA